MYVGVIPALAHMLLCGKRIPHVRGGDPSFGRTEYYRIEYSPCTWG